MNVDAIERAIQSFVRAHNQSIYMASSVQSKVLELGATVGVYEHYRSNGYEVHIENPKNRQNTFVVKTSTRGDPWNFSRIHLTKGRACAELHMNLMVRSAHDQGIYCVDVGIAKPGLVPTEKTSNKWICLENKGLISFAEVKKLVIYPMLLAQFVGIVHEIKPAFIGGKIPYGFRAHAHLAPCLISLGNFSGNSLNIVNTYPERNINIEIFSNFDVRIANTRGSHTETPFYKRDVDETG